MPIRISPPVIDWKTVAPDGTRPRLIAIVIAVIAPVAHSPTAHQYSFRDWRVRKAECTAEGCGFTLRIAARQVMNVGAPHCPKHAPWRSICRRGTRQTRNPARSSGKAV